MIDSRNVITENFNIIDKYHTARVTGQLTAEYVDEVKTDFLKNIEIKKNEIGDPQSPDYQILDLQKTALEKGWTIEDMPLMEKLGEVVYAPDAAHKEEGIALISKLTGGAGISTVADRSAFLREIIHFAGGFVEFNETDAVIDLTNQAADADDRTVAKVEFPGDPMLQEEKGHVVHVFDKKLHTKAVNEGLSKELRTAGLNYLQLSEEEKRQVRSRDIYVLPEKTQEQLEMRPVNRTTVAKGINVTNREAVKRVLGDAVYDEIDAAYTGTNQERTVKIHHSTGNKYMQAGKNVLEIDVAGSGFSQARREHHGLGGKVSESAMAKDPELEKAMELQYGNSIPDFIPGKSNLNHLRHKETTMEVDGKTVTKDRYTMAGPLGGWGQIGPKGSGNRGEYNIENTTENIEYIGTQHLEKVFAEWDENPETADDIYINLSGHSRGAVGVGEGMRKLQSWLSKEPQSRYKDKVHFNIIQMDPVPGFGSYAEHSENDYSAETNTESTVIYTMTTEQADYMFKPQAIYGAKRVIIGTTVHAVGLDTVDFSQIGQQGDQMAHRLGYYDAATGEFFRGSGLNELPAGVYFSDNNQNLIRLNSYSQLDKLMDEVTSEGAYKDSRRETVLRSVAKKWFVDNELTESYDNEVQRENINSARLEIEKRLLFGEQNGYDRMTELNKAIRNTIALEKKEGVSSEELTKQYDTLIRQCKEYMSGAEIPADEQSRSRMNDIGDLLSGLQREKNYLSKGLNPRKKAEAKSEDVLTGQLEKVENEITLRENIKSVRNHAADAAKEMLEAMKRDESKNRYEAGYTYQGNTVSFDTLKRALERCSELSENSTVNEIQGAFSAVANAAKGYHDFYDGYRVQKVLGFRADDPVDAFATQVETRFREDFRSFDAYAKHLGNKDLTLNQIIKEREYRKNELEETLKAVREKGPKKENAPEENVIMINDQNQIIEDMNHLVNQANRINEQNKIIGEMNRLVNDQLNKNDDNRNEINLEEEDKKSAINPKENEIDLKAYENEIIEHGEEEKKSDADLEKANKGKEDNADKIIENADVNREEPVREDEKVNNDRQVNEERAGNENEQQREEEHANENEQPREEEQNHVEGRANEGEQAHVDAPVNVGGNVNGQAHNEGAANNDRPEHNEGPENNEGLAHNEGGIVEPGNENPNPAPANQEAAQNGHYRYTEEENRPGGAHFRRLQDMVKICDGLVNTEEGYAGHTNSEQYDNMLQSFLDLNRLTKEYIRNDRPIPADGTPEGDRIRQMERTAMENAATYLRKKPKQSHVHSAGDTRQDLAFMGYMMLAEGPDYVNNAVADPNDPAAVARNNAMNARKNTIDALNSEIGHSAGLPENAGLYSENKLNALADRYKVGAAASRMEQALTHGINAYNAQLDPENEQGQRISENLIRLIKHPEAVDEYKDMLDTKHTARIIRWNSGLYNDTKEAVESFQRHRDKLIGLVQKADTTQEDLNREMRILADRYEKCRQLVPQYERKVLDPGQDAADKKTDAGFARAAGAQGLGMEFCKDMPADQVPNLNAENQRKVMSYRDLYSQEMADRKSRGLLEKHRNSAAEVAKQVRDAKKAEARQNPNNHHI